MCEANSLTCVHVRKFFECLPLSSGVPERIQQGQQPAPMKSALSLIAAVSFATLASAQPAAHRAHERAPASDRWCSVRGPAHSAPGRGEGPAARGYVEMLNPAFPRRIGRPRPVVQLGGRRYGLEDLTPYFADGKKKDAKDGLRPRPVPKARELLEGEGDSAARALPARAVAPCAPGTTSAPAAEMAALADDYPALRDRCLTHAGVALESLGRLTTRRRAARAGAGGLEAVRGRAAGAGARAAQEEGLRRRHGGADAAGAARTNQRSAPKPIPHHMMPSVVEVSVTIVSPGARSAIGGNPHSAGARPRPLSGAVRAGRAPWYRVDRSWLHGSGATGASWPSRHLLHLLHREATAACSSTPGVSRTRNLGIRLSPVRRREGRTGETA